MMIRESKAVLLKGINLILVSRFGFKATSAFYCDLIRITQFSPFPLTHYTCWTSFFKGTLLEILIFKIFFNRGQNF